ncbi:LIC10906 family membrane protein [Leptospira kmetyi]|uniref:LIC10906 family membrane protein n=1 Tax=Leptospira kmetyi TaxID=408139 RepID=UPI0002D99D48|nr:hypothetical protein [Leptospira kmetyi]EQA52200.1 hypothetical protein LEP1GSC052_4218 [Leptospira kmetyi serovar Malaysia str. Bejo-Iso9]
MLYFSFHQVLFLNFSAGIFSIILGLYVFYPKPRRPVQIHFGLLGACLGFWFLSFIVRDLCPYEYVKLVVNLGVAVSVPVPFFIFLISDSYRRRTYKPNPYIFYPHFALIAYLFLECAFIRVFTITSRQEEYVQISFNWIYPAILLYALIIFLFAIGKYGIKTWKTRGKTRVASALMVFGLVSPLIWLSWFLTQNPLAKGLFSRGQAAICCITGMLIWAIAILNCNAFRIPAFSLIEPRLPTFHRLTRPFFNFMTRMIDLKYYRQQELTRKEKIVMKMMIHNNELCKNESLSAIDRALILAQTYGNYLR